MQVRQTQLIAPMDQTDIVKHPTLDPLPPPSSRSEAKPELCSIELSAHESETKPRLHLNGKRVGRPVSRWAEAAEQPSQALRPCLLNKHYHRIYSLRAST